jgi:hypothetical protein
MSGLRGGGVPTGCLQVPYGEKEHNKAEHASADRGVAFCVKDRRTNIMESLNSEKDVFAHVEMAGEKKSYGLGETTTRGLPKMNRKGVLLVPQPTDDPNDPLVCRKPIF